MQRDRFIGQFAAGELEGSLTEVSDNLLQMAAKYCKMGYSNVGIDLFRCHCDDFGSSMQFEIWGNKK